MNILFPIVVSFNFVIFFITLLGLLVEDDLRVDVLFQCITSGLTSILLIIFMATTPLAKHVLDGNAVIEYKIQDGNVVDSCYVFKKQ